MISNQREELTPLVSNPTSVHLQYNENVNSTPPTGYHPAESGKSQFSEWLSNQSKELICELQIVISLFFFGISFVGQKKAMLNGMQPITYNFCRYFVSTVVLFIVKDIAGWKLQIREEDSLNYLAESSLHATIEDSSLAVTEHYRSSVSHSLDSLERRKQARLSRERQQLIFYAIILGLCNYGGSMLQQIGLVTVTAGKTGFITGMFVVFVPLVEYIFIPKYRSNMNVTLFFSVAMSFTGLYLLSGCLEAEVCIGGALKEGEVIVFVSMWFWVFSILVADYGAKSVEVIELTYYEFIIVTVLTFFSALYFEPDNFVYPYSTITANWDMIIMVGITEALAFAFSTLGQMYTPPTRASILFSMESVLCAILAYFLLHETLTRIELYGAIAMTCAAILSSIATNKEEEEQAADRLDEDLIQYYDAVDGGGQYERSEESSRRSNRISDLIVDDISSSIPIGRPSDTYYQYNPYASLSPDSWHDLTRSSFPHERSRLNTAEYFDTQEPPVTVPSNKSKSSDGSASSTHSSHPTITTANAFHAVEEGFAHKYYTYRRPSQG